jgi:hypothetical protein
MEDVFGLKASRLRNDSFTWFALPHFFPDAVEFRHNAGSGGAMNGAIHSGPARKPRISRIYDSVGLHEGNIALFE